MPAHPFDVIEYRGRAQYSAFAPGSSQLTVVVLSFCILFFIICTQVDFVFLVIV